MPGPPWRKSEIRPIEPVRVGDLAGEHADRRAVRLRVVERDDVLAFGQDRARDARREGHGPMVAAPARAHATTRPVSVRRRGRGRSVPIRRLGAASSGRHRRLGGGHQAGRDVHERRHDVVGDEPGGPAGIARVDDLPAGPRVADEGQDLVGHRVADEERLVVRRDREDAASALDPDAALVDGLDEVHRSLHGCDIGLRRGRHARPGPAARSGCRRSGSSRVASRGTARHASGVTVASPSWRPNPNPDPHRKSRIRSGTTRSAGRPRGPP